MKLIVTSKKERHKEEEKRKKQREQKEWTGENLVKKKRTERDVKKLQLRNS
jgi:hypothetical protein